MANNRRSVKKKTSRVRKLTDDEISLRNSPMVIRKHEEALQVYNSPQYLKHAEKRQARRKASLAKSNK